MTMSHCKNLLKRFQTYRESNFMSDITFVVGKEKFFLHKILLSAASDYFEKLFTTDMIEKEQDVIKLNEISGSSFRSCVDFIYSGELDVNLDEVGDLLYAADLFLLWDIKEKCIEKVKTNVSRMNCVSLYQQIVNCSEIREIAKEVILKNGSDILNDRTELLNMNSATLEMMFKSEFLMIRHESEAFNGLINWLNENKSERDMFFCNLLKYVRLPVIDRDFFTRTIFTSEHFKQDCANCKSYLEKTMLHLIDGKSHELRHYQMNVRWNDYNTDIIVVDSFCNEFQYFIPEYDIVSELNNDVEPVPMNTSCNAIAYHKHRIYVLGENYGRRSYYCDFRKEENSWIELPEMPRDHNDGLYRSQVVTYGDKLLVIGGGKDKIGLNIIDCFDVVQKRWSEFLPLNEGRCNLSVVVANENIFAIGGLNQQSLTSVEMYNASSKQWECKASMSVAREHAISNYYKGRVYVAGGCYTLRSAETYSREENIWTRIDDLNIGRHGGGSFIFNHQLYVFGGSRDHDSLFEIWNVDAGQWEESDCEDDNISSCVVLTCHKPINHHGNN